ncbi:TonB-dependent receptor [Catenovulum maritimum]|uniref:TonB-dependent receptor n=1 Tax=Catenovulum maritimum TaxID=1513271 RepID=A0A0J8GVX5_9ALTE|nr:TonB-dependent receptor [Catenovulum maritimum]KMT65459.1 TonB-dependent receptor [Catenovulum maritimum]
MKQFKPSILTLALATTGLFSGYNYAADQGLDEEVETIKITGLRGALMRAQVTKMESTSVVEVISAEDIGKLPDSSIAESLSRLPGMAGERRDGRTSGISVRGFREDYSGSTMNGRELLGMGDNRGVEFDLYPSEIMSGVTVYKSPEAKLTTQGVAGTVDLQTAKPLTSDEYFAINMNLEQNGMKSGNPDFDDNGHRLAVSFSQKFADDTIGVAVAYATTESPSQEEQFRGWGYADVGLEDKDEDGNVTKDHVYDAITNPAGTIRLENGLTKDDLAGAKILGGHDSYVRSALLERDTLAAVVQFKPSDDLTISLDALKIDFSDTQVKRGFEEGGAEWGTGKHYTISSVEKGLVTAGRAGDSNNAFKTVVRNDSYAKTADLTAFGANIKYQLNEDWKLELDLSSSEVDKKIIDIESYSGVGRSRHKDQGAGMIRGFEMTSTGVMYNQPTGVTNPDLSDTAVVKLAGPQSWGGGMQGFADRFPENTTQAKNSDAPITYAEAQDGFVNEPVFHEEMDALKFNATGLVELGPITKLHTGIRYSDRSKSKDNRGAFLTSTAWPDQGQIPEEYIVGQTSLGFLGLGNMVAYDSLAMFDNNEYTKGDAALFETGRKGDSYTVSEEMTQIYLQADIEAEIGSIYVRGNMGVQYVDTTQSSSGFFAQIGEGSLVNAAETSEELSYSTVLPSLSLNFELMDDHILRTAVAKTQTRPRIDDMKAGGKVDFSFNPGRVASTTIDNSPWSADSGNPFLKPLEANQFDLAYDWYFAEDGFMSAAFFYKDITNWHYQASLPRDFSDAYIASYHKTEDDQGNVITPGTFMGISSAKIDGLEGFVRGYEFQVTLPLNLVADSLDGFGVMFSAAFNDGNLNTFEGVKLDETLEIPGLSDETYSLVGYYESGGLQIRIAGTKRDEFLTEDRGLSLALEPSTDNGSTLWDAQIGYDFGKGGFNSLEGLTVSLQAQNITDEDQVKFANGDPRQIVKHQSFGSNYLLGLNYKF